AEPWISVNPNYVDINAAEQMEDSDSVYAFYKYLIALRHSEPIVSAGSWNLVDADDECVYAFVRELKSDCAKQDDSAETAAESVAKSAKSNAESNAESTERMLVMVNMTDSTVPIPTQSAQLLQNRASNSFTTHDVMVTTYDVNHALTSLKNGTLAPWEGIAVTLQ
ncbi:glucohydrolase, partial [Bifidobacteriaceae bacterium NR015]